MSVEFDGVADAIRQGLNLPTLNGVDGASFAFWLFLDTLPPTGPDPTDKYCPMAISVGPGTDPPNNTSRMEVEVHSEPTQTEAHYNITARALDSDSGSVLSSDPATAQAQTPVHIVATVNFQTRVGHLYINGLESGLDFSAIFDNMTAGSTSATNSAVGSVGSEDSGTPEFLDGRVEDMRIYARELTPQEAQTIFATEGIDGIVRGLQKRFEFQDNADGITTTQSSPADSGSQQMNPATLTGAPTYRESIRPTFRRRVP